jgi:hypothetical protein
MFSEIQNIMNSVRFGAFVVNKCAEIFLVTQSCHHHCWCGAWPYIAYISRFRHNFASLSLYQWHITTATLMMVIEEISEMFTLAKCWHGWFGKEILAHLFPMNNLIYNFNECLLERPEGKGVYCVEVMGLSRAHLLGTVKRKCRYGLGL